MTTGRLFFGREQSPLLEGRPAKYAYRRNKRMSAGLLKVGREKIARGFPGITPTRDWKYFEKFQKL